MIQQPPVGFEEALNEDMTDHSSHNLYSGETCSGKTCTANEHCCEGHTCVDTDESKNPSKVFENPRIPETPTRTYK